MTLSDKVYIVLLICSGALSISILISKLFVYRLERRLNRLERKLLELSIDNASVIPNAIQQELAKKLRKQMGLQDDD